MEIEADSVSTMALLDRLSQMPRDALLASWALEAAQLSNAEGEKIVHMVSHLTAVGTQSLNRELKGVRESASRVAGTAEFRERVGDRLSICYEIENRTRQAHHVEQAIVAAAPPGSYVAFGGALAQVATKPLPYTHHIDDSEIVSPSVPQIVPLDDVAVLSRVEDVVVFFAEKKGRPTPIGVPPMIVKILLEQHDHAAPIVNGLVTHPVVLPRDGSILAADGLHVETGLFLAGASLTDARPYDKDEAIAAFSRLLTNFLEGFEFASELDEHVALAGLFTGVQRRVLEMAPGLAALASTQASGKTTLARRLHVVLTGQDMPVSTFPQGDEAEVQKRLLSTLLRSPAMVCFDNITDGTTFRSSAVAAAMTGPTLSQRVLGMSRDADCPTNVLFVITGNNLSLGADEVTRWLISRLEPRAAQPEQRRFKHPNVVAHALKMRAGVLRDVVGIVAGYLASNVKMENATRFSTWDQMIRQPIIWAGGRDMAEAFQANAESSEDVQAHKALLAALEEAFGKEEFTAADVVKAVERKVGVGLHLSDLKAHWPMTKLSQPHQQELGEAMASALSSLRAKDVRSEQSVGRVLKAKEGRVAYIDDDGLLSAKLMSRIVSGRSKFRVVLD